MSENIYDVIMTTIPFARLFECKSGYMDSEDCSWYHHNWMLLRSLGLVSNPFWHENFYRYAINKWGKKHLCNTLVLGTADFSMPILCQQAGLNNIDICDICKTPLNICDFISDMFSYDWNTYSSDIRNGIDKKYDIIINDAFLTRFNYTEKLYVLENISNVLSTNGVYITTMRQGWNKGQAIRPTEKQMNDFIKRAVAAAENVGVDVNLASNAASEYIHQILSYPIKDERYLRKLIDGLFNIEKINVVDIEGECVPSRYFQLVLSKK